MTDKTYRGHIFGFAVSVGNGRGRRPRRLKPRFDLRNASPTGFAWGYGGSGPAQLSIALLADATGDDQLALRFHQHFKWEVISRLDQERAWSMTDADVRKWVQEHEDYLLVLAERD